MKKTSKPAKEHKEKGPKMISAAVITVSNSRTPDTDESGILIKKSLLMNGHNIVRYAMCKDDSSNINQELDSSLTTGCDVVILNGGTGLAPTDITIEAIAPCLEKRLEGFGELFRQLSFQKIGSAAMLSRAIAGTCKGTLVFCLPGSPEAVDLALNNLIIPEIGHMVGLIRGQKTPH